MATNLMRFEKQDRAWWGVVLGGQITPLADDSPTTAALQYLKLGDRINARIWSRGGALDLGEQITEIAV